MDTTQRYIHTRLQNDWENFPFKLDYIFYLLYSADTNMPDTVLTLIGDRYVIGNTKGLGQAYQKPEYSQFSIHKDELLNHLNIADSKSEPLDFAYKTEIFSENYSFRCHKLPLKNGDILSFRFLDTRPINISSLFVSVGKITHIDDKFKDKPLFSEFNKDFINFLEKYNLYDQLKENLSTNEISEKKLKL